MDDKFPISRDPPEGGTKLVSIRGLRLKLLFPISRDPPEGGTIVIHLPRGGYMEFPISRDPPEGGTPPPNTPRR